MKKILLMITALMTALTLAGCSWSVGTKNEAPDYDELFTRGNGTDKSSMVGYNIDLKEHGSVKLYIDTTFGHKFRLDSETNIFTVSDKDGNDVVSGIFAEDENYDMYSASYPEKELTDINGREFAVAYDENAAKYAAFTYLSDCGADIGCIISSESTDNYKYIAFLSNGTAPAQTRADISEPTETTPSEADFSETETQVSEITVSAVEECQLVFPNGNGFNCDTYDFAKADNGGQTGANLYSITANSTEYLMELSSRKQTDYIEIADALAESIKAESDITPTVDIHSEGAYITGVYKGLLTLIFTADGADGVTYIMSLYTTDTDNAADLFNTVIDSFLSSGITSADTRTEYGEAVTTTSDNGSYAVAEDGFPEFTIPDGYEIIYDGEYNKSYMSSSISMSLKSSPDEEYSRFLNGETKTYFDIYQMTELGAFTSEKYGEIIISEGVADNVYTYFAADRNGIINMQFSDYVSNRLTLDECSEIIKSFIG